MEVPISHPCDVFRCVDKSDERKGVKRGREERERERGKEEWVKGKERQGVIRACQRGFPVFIISSCCSVGRVLSPLSLSS